LATPWSITPPIAFSGCGGVSSLYSNVVDPRRPDLPGEGVQPGERVGPRRGERRFF